jgi:NAD(P)-dependent dehydrogenase (short-subunit alcohol dehydrogenase family)/acyl carrier protein
MLDLDLDLEADLGVDTVKQAEMFAAIREIYNIPRDENRKLRDYPTLAHVIQFVYSQRPDLASTAEPTAITRTGAIEETGAPAELRKTEVATAESSDCQDSIKKKILEIVAEKTGYPQDMLDLDLDLEADLGIDTVKQAEMFAAVRAAYNIPRDETLKLREFPTLAHVIRFAQERQPKPTNASNAKAVSTESTQEVEGATPPSSSSAATSEGEQPVPVLASFEAADRVPRRVPVPNLRPPLSMCKPTSVMLSAGSRVVLGCDKNGVADALTSELTQKGVAVLKIEPMADSEALQKMLQDWLAAGPVQGVYWLPALDCEKTISAMSSAEWHDAIDRRLKAFYVTMRTLYQPISAPGTFLLAGTRLGGQHGYDSPGAIAPLGGSVAGFTKTYKRERIDALVKVVDFGKEATTSEVASKLVAETLQDPGAVEIGYKHGLRWTISLEEQPAADGQPGLKLDKNSVFVITGAAGSIVSAITSDLAAASSGTFYLLDLVPKPDPQNPDLKRFVSDKEGLKRDLFARIQSRGERATPALVEKDLAALERAHAAQSAITAVQAAGGAAHYFSVNLTDTNAVAKVIDQVRQQSGHIDVLLHAAGMERSHLLSDKDANEFNLIFDVKADGWFNLLHAIGDMPLKATVVFSSIAGRFGNAGQTDYSSANDLLCKIISSFRTTRPGTRGIAIDWTAWAGMGMATRGSIPKMMELAGIDMLPPQAGIPLIRRELTAGGTRGEIVVGQRLGILLNEWDPDGGLNTSEESDEFLAHGPMFGKIAGMGIHNGLTVEAELDPTVQPFLKDHQIDGTPVLPGVMGVEAFAEAAVCLLPAWHVEAIDNVDFLAPFKFYKNERRTLSLQTRIHPRNDAVVADCALIGRRTLANQVEPIVTTHFTGSVRLTKECAQVQKATKVISPHGSLIEARDIYRVYFHGPAYQVLERAWWDGIRMVGLLAGQLPDNHQPSSQRLLIQPRLVELCFQTAGLWEMATQGRMGLPAHIDQLRVWPVPDALEEHLFAVVTPIPEDGFDAQVVGSAGNLYVHLRGYRTVAVPKAIDAESLNALQSLISLAPVAA